MVAAALVPSAGCSSKRRHYKHPKFVTQADAVRYMQRALTSELPDERREDVQQIARTRHLKHAVILEGMSTIARTDRSEAVRCAALAALGKADDPSTAPALIAVLGGTPSESSELRSRSAGAPVRAEALRAAAVLVRNEGLAPADRDAFRTIAVQLLGRDPSRDVRQAAAVVLAYCPHREVLDPLIDHLEERDFGVVYESERSLMRLTGHSFEHDPFAWRQWLAETDEPFADAGRLDDVLDAPPKGWWKESVEDTRRTLASFKPKKDDS